MARLGETRETSLSLESQRAVIADWAASNGFVVAEAIADHDLKGDDPTRPGLAALAAAAQPGDTVAVYKFDRLARDVVLQETVVRQLQARNVQVISVTEPSTRLTREIVVAMTANRYSVAEGPLALNVVGFDASVPQVVSQFVDGAI